MIGAQIKKLRRALGLTQKEFGECIGVKPNTIGTYEIERSEPLDAVVSLICREFNVSENWLRTGQGDMLQPKTRSDEIDAFMKEILHDDSDFRQKFISVLARMTADEWKLLERKALELASEVIGGVSAAPPQTDTDIEQEADAAAAEVRKQVILEKKAEAESSASPSYTGGTAGEKMA